MPIFDTLQLAGFDGVQFPVEEVHVKGGLRDHVHEYPHSPGGAPEKLGRKLYVVRMVGNFQNRFARWPGLWPTSLATLRHNFENELTSDLVIPTIGSMKAYCIDWDQHMVSKIRSGEKTEFTFREDSASAFLISSLTQKSVTTSLKSAGAAFFDEAAAKREATTTPVVDRNLFSQLQNSFNSVIAVLETPAMYGTVLESRVDALANMCETADRSLQVLRNPTAYRLMEALQDLWASTRSLAGNVLGRQSPLKVFVTPTVMTVTQVSQAIYDDTSHASDVLQMNGFEDAFAIPAGYEVKYYDATADAA